MTACLLYLSTASESHACLLVCRLARLVQPLNRPPLVTAMVRVWRQWSVQASNCPRLTQRSNMPSPPGPKLLKQQSRSWLGASPGRAVGPRNPTRLGEARELPKKKEKTAGQEARARARGATCGRQASRRIASRPAEPSDAIRPPAPSPPRPH